MSLPVTTPLGPLGSPQGVSAASGADVTWKISSEAAEAKPGYAKSINPMRARTERNDSFRTIPKALSLPAGTCDDTDLPKLETSISRSRSQRNRT